MKIEIETKEMLVREALQDAMTYEMYRNVVAQHAANETSTGDEQSESLSEYTQLNNARMRRLDKTLRIPDAVKERFKNFNGNLIWLVLTESWCGDAAQSLPAMQKVSDLTQGIDFKIVLRDANSKLMNAFLTNGSRSIPKLIVFDNEKQQVITQWGPRPSKATVLVDNFKAAHGMLTPEFKKDLQVWYTKDKGETIFEDLAQLIA
jgi:hypothetical protein